VGREPRNVEASVRQRLLNIARATGRPFNDVLQRFAMERFLYRLAQWQAFLRKGRFTGVPNELHLVVERVASFLLPILGQLQSGGLLDARWTLEGRWGRPAIG
jgi:hypothetical protein